MHRNHTSLFKPTRHEPIERVTPPTVHLLPWITGGLKRIYKELKTKSQTLHEFGCYTNKEGHFSPSHGMPLLAFRFKFVQIVGDGQSSIFVKAQDTFRDNAYVAIKVLHSQNISLGFQETDCLRKLNLADPESFSATLRLYTTFLFDDHYCMVFEMLDPRPLNKHFEGLAGKERLDTLREVAIRLLQSLGFLQQENVIHADLKPENILLKSEGNFASLKIVDFGNSINCIHSELSLYYSDFELQTLIYRAPEVMMGLSFGVEVDIWSLGCILAELYTGQPLFYGREKSTVMQQMVQVLGPMPQDFCRRGKFFQDYKSFTGKSNQPDATRPLMGPLKCSNYAFADFLSGLLRYNPKERMSVSEAAQHPFLAPYLGIKYLMPCQTHEEAAYPRVMLSRRQYSKAPHIDEDIHEKCMDSLELLRHGTHKKEAQTIAIRPLPVLSNGLNLTLGKPYNKSIPSDLLQSTSGQARRVQTLQDFAASKATRQLFQSPDQCISSSSNDDFSPQTTKLLADKQRTGSSDKRRRAAGGVAMFVNPVCPAGQDQYQDSLKIGTSQKLQSNASHHDYSTGSSSLNASDRTRQKWTSSKISAFLSKASSTKLTTPVNNLTPHTLSESTTQEVNSSYGMKTVGSIHSSNNLVDSTSPAQWSTVNGSYNEELSSAPKLISSEPGEDVSGHEKWLRLQQGVSGMNSEQEPQTTELSSMISPPENTRMNPKPDTKSIHSCGVNPLVPCHECNSKSAPSKSGADFDTLSFSQQAFIEIKPELKGLDLSCSDQQNDPGSDKGKMFHSSASICHSVTDSLTTLTEDVVCVSANQKSCNDVEELASQQSLTQRNLITKPTVISGSKPHSTGSYSFPPKMNTTSHGSKNSQHCSKDIRILDSAINGSVVQNNTSKCNPTLKNKQLLIPDESGHSFQGKRGRRKTKKSTLELGSTLERTNEVFPDESKNRKRQLNTNSVSVKSSHLHRACTQNVNYEEKEVKVGVSANCKRRKMKGNSQKMPPFSKKQKGTEEPVRDQLASGSDSSQEAYGYKPTPGRTATQTLHWSAICDDDSASSSSDQVLLL